MRGLAAIVVIANGLQLAPSSAASATEALRGIGFATCEEMLTWNANGVDTSDVVSWLYGFWSAENRAIFQSNGEMKNIMHSSVAPEALIARLLSYCRERPTDILATAGQEIFDLLPPASE